MKPYYEEGGITIYHGDCREILPQLPRVDLVLTDPPYGAGKADWDQSFEADWMNQASQVTDSLAVMPGIANLTKMPHRVNGLEYRWTLAAYISNGMTRGLFGFGNWIPCMVYTDPFHSLHCHSQDFLFTVINGWKPDHPSPKPLPVMRWLISRFNGDVVLDPFMGSGTTLVAAKNLNRHAIGIEIEERYCEIAAKRLAQAVFDFSEPEPQPEQLTLAS